MSTAKKNKKVINRWTICGQMNGDGKKRRNCKIPSVCLPAAKFSVLLLTFRQNKGKIALDFFAN